MGLLGELLGWPAKPPNTLMDLASAVIQGHPGGLGGLLQQFAAAVSTARPAHG